jgi:hypothetical protein
MPFFRVGIVLQSILSLTLMADSMAAEENLAPSCTKLVASFQYKEEIKDLTLLAVVGDRLVDVYDATFKRGGTYQFYYVYQNKICESQSCVSMPIVSIKTLKLTSEPSSTVFLSREGTSRDQSLIRSKYEEFHRDPAVIPSGPFAVFNNFHITYRSPENQKLYTHFPKERRDTYLFADIPADKAPWLKVRNYRFKLNANSGPQCIPFDLTLQRSTESAYIAITEVEDGSGGNPQQADRWNLKLN